MSLIHETKRLRVNGNGPKRNAMVTFAKIGTVSVAVGSKYK